MRYLSLALGACALFGNAAAGVAAPQEPIGSAVAVVNLVKAELSTETRNLAIGDGVRENEIIDVAPDARSELKLNDDTKLAIGPGARLVLDKFVYDPVKTSGNIAVDLAKGAFRFMTGVATKQSYVVRVPGASITVRGTIFDVFVQDNGTSWILLHEGGVRVCNVRGTCRELNDPGHMLLINDTGDIGKVFRWSSLKGMQGFDFDTAFPFVSTPPTIGPKPVFTKDALINEPNEPAPKKKRRAQSTPDKETQPIRTASNDPQAGGKTVNTTVMEPNPKRKIVNLVAIGPPRIKRPKKPRDDAEVTGTKRRWLDYAEQMAPGLVDRIRTRPDRGVEATSPDLPPARTVNFQPFPRMSPDTGISKPPTDGGGGGLR